MIEEELFQKIGEGTMAFYQRNQQHRPKKCIVVETTQDGIVYVHFLSGDRRNDKWVPTEHLQVIEDQQGPQSRRNRITTAEKVNVKELYFICIGKNKIPVWYLSPFPRIYTKTKRLYICEYCLLYFQTEEELHKHQNEVVECTPPGTEVYRDENISLFEIRGRNQKLYCQTLSLIGKSFIESKSLTYAVETYVFYVLCLCDEAGAHFIGYFSRESRNSEKLISCIVVLPPYQSKGYGGLLMSISYEIGKRLRKVGGPERPLSDKGRKGFLRYWKVTALRELQTHGEAIKSIEQLSYMTSITQEDLTEALTELDLLTTNESTGELKIDHSKLPLVSDMWKEKLVRSRFVRPEHFTFVSQDRERKRTDGGKQTLDKSEKEADSESSPVHHKHKKDILDLFSSRLI